MQHWDRWTDHSHCLGNVNNQFNKATPAKLAVTSSSWNPLYFVIFFTQTEWDFCFIKGTILLQTQGYYHGRIVKINLKYLLQSIFQLNFSLKFWPPLVLQCDMDIIDCAPIEIISEENRQFSSFLSVILMYLD